MTIFYCFDYIYSMYMYNVHVYIHLELEKLSQVYECTVHVHVPFRKSFCGLGLIS